MATRRKHLGISLLEVLISTFILLIGLLGVASLLAVGHHESQQALYADRAATVAKYAYRDFRIRGSHPEQALGNRFIWIDDHKLSWRFTILDSSGRVVGPDDFVPLPSYLLKIEVLLSYDDDLPHDDPKNLPVLITERPFPPSGSLPW